MITIKFLKDKTTELIAISDIPKNTILFTCLWTNQISDNPFFLPKTQLDLNSLTENAVSTDDLFIKIRLSGFGEYIKYDRYGNSYPIIDYTNKSISFISNRLIKKNESITYIFSLESFPNVTIR